MEISEKFGMAQPSISNIIKDFTSNEVVVQCLKGRCRKEAKPQFLIRNFNDPALELWMCEGCKEFLLRIDEKNGY
jgi:hypothetical protein